MCHDLNLGATFVTVLRLTTSVVDRLLTLLHMGNATVDVCYEHVFLLKKKKCACLVFYMNKFKNFFKLFATQNTRVVVAHARI